MTDENFKYCIFPVSLIRGAFSDISAVIDCIFKYVVFKHTEKLKHETELEKMKAAANVFNITFGCGIEEALKAAKRLECNFDLKTPQVRLGKDMLWDYYKNHKDEFSIACFCAFCAIKSILGNKEYAKTNKRFVVARMFGKTGREEKPEYPETFSSYSDASAYLGKRHGVNCCSCGSIRNAAVNGTLPVERPQKNSVMIERSALDKWFSENYSKSQSVSLEEKYATRYHIDRVLYELQMNWGLKLYSDHSRGFYLSFTKELKDLAVVNELAKRKHNELADIKRNAKEEALKILNRK